MVFLRINRLYTSSHNHGSEKRVPPIIATFQIQPFPLPWPWEKKYRIKGEPWIYLQFCFFVAGGSRSVPRLPSDFVEECITTSWGCYIDVVDIIDITFGMLPLTLLIPYSACLVCIPQGPSLLQKVCAKSGAKRLCRNNFSTNSQCVSVSNRNPEAWAPTPTEEGPKENVKEALTLWQTLGDTLTCII